ncbi:hypothetical protein FA04_13930 [Ensifer adhaerens]|uniref:DUF6525 family protein n=1 Tax=Ensifer adhaerens TaxID=106592 RepID=A0ABY8HCL5_ENSAD|nr:DUF6525 family protein [Ensifer adhaerens]ANK73622.1 hypothetical protein FA04_13930 [Ensifer adhaerens]KDP73649.1 hypothetical protein FA04_11130 [Ensifer adhaerens]WFP89698.1 DUF6525 family protein [Ensifer adhaerens]
MINILDRRSSVDVMRDYDALPKPVREAVASAHFAYDPRILAKRIARGRSPDDVVAMIRPLAARSAQ